MSDKIRAEGAAAYFGGKRPKDNPYRFSDQPAVMLWVRGFNQAMLEQRIANRLYEAGKIDKTQPFTSEVTP